jgi:hypothetical protein
MTGRRAAELKDLLFEPGFFTVTTPRAARNRWIDGDRIRFFQGYPEKMLGWQYISLTQGSTTDATYIGIARALHDWASLDKQQWIAIGTHVKLYLANSSRLYDITPLRKTSNVSGALATTNGSATVTVTDNDHRAEPGDYVTIVGAAAVAGITVAGSYQVQTVGGGGNTFTITHSAPANAATTGGGTFSIEYDIAAGLASNGEKLGYGTGLYGAGTYGTPRPAGQGLRARMRTWSLDNWGEDLVASYNDGEIYHWDRTSGPNSRARLLQNAPKQVQRILVNPENRHLIAFGAQFQNGEADPMRIRWCSQEDFDTWVPDPDDTSNTAGSKRLDHGSRLVTAIKTRKTNYCWSDTQMYNVPFVGPNETFGAEPLGSCQIIGPNAAVDADGIVYFMAHDNFYVYDGVLRVLPCAVWDTVFGKGAENAATRIDKEQVEKVFGSTFLSRNEIRWEYASEAGSGECDRYVIYNTGLDCWYFGSMTRTAYHDISEAAGLNGVKAPYAVYGGYLYRQETGLDQVEQVGTTAQSWYIRSADLSVGGSDRIVLINNIVPEYKRLNGDVSVSVFTKQKPMQAAYTQKGPYTFAATAEDYDIRARGPQIALRVSGSALAQDMRMGIFQVLPTLSVGSRGK